MPSKFSRMFILAVVGLSFLAGCSGESPPAGVEEGTAGIASLSASGTGDGSSGGADESSTGDAGPTCTNGALDGDESDVDCGGSCSPCAPGQTCNTPSDCVDGVCTSGVCQGATCYDGVLNANEVGVDCGGGCPNACADTGCNTDNDCGPGEFCAADGECAPSACDNEVKDSRETAVDCGGTDCPACADGLACLVGRDCVSGVCDGTTKLCVAASCGDLVQNGDETDLDCGGTCIGCAPSRSCLVHDDCLSFVCTDNNCIAPNCSDGVENGDETDEDCGGSCSDCGAGRGCAAPSDCDTGVCVNNVCASPGCMDGVQNGDETDLDCGGACGATCTPGASCFDAGDCVQGVCEFGQCSTPDCLDGVQNGNETAVDCGGSCGATCDPGEGCAAAGDCAQGVCGVGMVCTAATCMDGVQNGDETAVDCGGSCVQGCGAGQACLGPDDCEDGVCTLNTCQAATCSDGVANGDEGGIDCQGSCPNPCDLGGEQAVNTFLPDSQLAPALARAPSGDFFVVSWMSAPLSSPAQDGSGVGIFARVYDSGGLPLGDEFQVNTTTAGNQTNPAVAAYDAGFVVTWESPDSDGGGVFAKRYDAAGAEVTAEFQVNTTSTGTQRRPDVAADNGGAFVICYEHRPTTSYEVLCQRYTNAGVADGAAIQANSTTVGDQQLPRVGRDGGGVFTVVWQSSNDQDGNGIGVFMRRYDAAGTAVTSETQVNTTVAGNQSGPAIRVNASGAYVVAWSSDNQDGNSTAVVARRYDNTGTGQGGEFVVNTYTSGAQNNPAVGMNSNGDFMIVWVSANQDGSLTGVYGQRYTAAGATIGVEFRVNTTTSGFQEEPDVVIRGLQEPIVAYSSGPTSNRDVVMKRYAGDFP